MLGFFWALIQPFFLLALYTLAFGVILRARWGFTDSTSSYALMLFSGLIIVNCFNSVLKNSVSAVYGKPNLVKKINAPLELVPLVIVVTALVDSALSIFVWFLGYLTIVGVPPVTSLYLIGIFVCFLPLLVATSWLISSLSVFLKDLEHVITMFSHVLLFATPVFYSLDAAPPFLRMILLLNPLTYLVETFRLVAYYGEKPGLTGLAIFGFIALMFAWLSLFVYRRLRPYFAEVV